MKEPQKASEWGKLIKGKEEVDNTLCWPLYDDLAHRLTTLHAWRFIEVFEWQVPGRGTCFQNLFRRRVMCLLQNLVYMSFLPPNSW